MKNEKIASFNGLRFIMMVAIIINHLHLLGTLNGFGEIFKKVAGMACYLPYRRF